MMNTNRFGAGPPGDIPLLDVSVQSDGASTLFVEVRGELDLATGAILKRHLEPYGDRSTHDGVPRRVIYRLSDLHFMDATGLNALLTAVDGHGPSTIIVREPSAPVRRVLQLVGMESIIEGADQEANR